MADKGSVHWHTASPLCECGLKVGTMIPETQQRTGKLAILHISWTLPGERQEQRAWPHS